MSPARSKRQAAIPHHRSRSELVKAVAVGAGIVVATVLIVWLMRPGPPGIPGTGGLVNRQPRSSWLVLLTLGAGAFAIWWILRFKRARAKVLIPIAVGVVLVAAVVAGFLWPGGLLRHDVAPAPVPEPTTTTTGKNASTTSVPGGTGGTGGTGGSGTRSGTPTTGTPTTGVPTTGTPSTATPTTGTSTTESP